MQDCIILHQFSFDTKRHIPKKIEINNLNIYTNIKDKLYDQKINKYESNTIEFEFELNLRILQCILLRDVPTFI